MSPVWALALITLVLVLGFLAWNRVSVARHRASGGGHTEGIGGPNDPMAGSRKLDRSPEEMRAALDEANTAAPRGQPQVRGSGAFRDAAPQSREDVRSVSRPV